MLFPTSRRRRVFGGLLAATVVLTACTGAPPNEPGTTPPATTNTQASASSDGWVDVTPPGLVPATLSAGSAGVLIGGASATGDTAGNSAGSNSASSTAAGSTSADDGGDGGAPQPLLAVRQGSLWQNIPASATTAYGELATMVHVGMGPDSQVVAIGTVTGGAHLNPRWSAWIGSTAGVTEEPQSVETFGGPEAGGVTGVVSGANPLVVGTWSMVAGVIGVATWQHHFLDGPGTGSATTGPTWVRAPSPPTLAGTAQELTTATATAPTGLGTGAVITGFTTSFRGGLVHQQAIVWISAGGAPGSDAEPASWTRVDLDSGGSAVASSAAEAGAGDAGGEQESAVEDSAATDVSCSAGACVVVGRLGDRLAAWHVDANSAVGTRISDLPVQPVDHYLGQPRVGVDGTMTVIAPGADGDPLLMSGGTGWTSAPVPAGEQRQVGVAAGTAYLLLRPATGSQVVLARATD